MRVVEIMDLYGDGEKVGLVTFKDDETKLKMRLAKDFDEPVFPFFEKEILNLVDKKKKSLEGTEVIVNGKTTVMIKDGKKYIAKPEAGEKFDVEKGILVCLAKASGYKTSDILELIDRIQFQPKKVSDNKKKTNKKK